MTDGQIQSIFELYQSNKESEICKIYPNEYFKFTKVIIEQPTVIDGEIVKNKKGEIKPDVSKRDSERIPFGEDIEEYFEREVKPNLPDSWMDRSKDKTGYEINFSKYFYRFNPPRSLDDINNDLMKQDAELKKLYLELMGE